MRTRTHASATRPVHHRLTILVAVLVALLAPLATGLPVQAQTARTRAASGNPLGGREWGIDTHDIVFKTYETSAGTTRDLLAKLALRPRVFWFTDNVPASEIRGKIRDYITKSQAGDRDKLVQLAVFRLWPRTEHRRDEPLTLAERAAYRRWVDNAARGIGSARVALVLEPDLAVSLKGWRPSVRLGLARYATKVFAGLPRTTVYLDAGSSDWLGVPQAVSMLRAAGIRYARGFSLGATHYTSPTSEIAYGTQVTAALAKAGFRKHFVVDTPTAGGRSPGRSTGPTTRAGTSTTQSTAAPSANAGASPSASRRRRTCGGRGGASRRSGWRRPGRTSTRTCGSAVRGSSMPPRRTST